MTILVTGSREFTDYDMMRSAIADYKPSLVIHGGARGADKLAGRVASELGIAVKVVLPDWEAFGRGAGFRRNCDMVNMGPDLVLAFFTHHACRGTTQCVEYAEDCGMPVVAYMELSP